MPFWRAVTVVAPESNARTVRSNTKQNTKKNTMVGAKQCALKALKAYNGGCKTEYKTECKQLLLDIHKSIRQHAAFQNVKLHGHCFKLSSRAKQSIRQLS